MANTKLRFAVIGCGRMGLRRMQTIVDHPQAELICVVDVSEQQARVAANKYGCPYYLNYGEILSREDIDCVIVSVPNKWHKEIVVSFLNSKKHVFCEKPLARNPEEAKAMVDAAVQNGVTLKTGSNLRFFPSVLKAKELLDRGAIGELLFLRSWIGHGGWVQGRWFTQPEIAGGGTFLDNGCHVLDITRWFLGEIKSCVGVIKTSLWPIEPLEDNGFGIFETVDGKIAFVHASWTEWAGYMYMEIYGSEGYIRIDNRGKACKTILGKREGGEKVFDFSSLPPTSYWDELDDYIRALREGRQPLPSGFDGLRAVQMAWGVYESARTGRKIQI
ncbi:MAG: Gfo/Idh/MocA family oxidoreductase [Chloroflexi bacterium]|nr:Gfo/Idh/MocA family oxidoreductase [Chloroflexota bacterium]